MVYFFVCFSNHIRSFWACIIFDIILFSWNKASCRAVVADTIGALGLILQCFRDSQWRNKCKNLDRMIKNWLQTSLQEWLALLFILSSVWGEGKCSIMSVDSMLTLCIPVIADLWLGSHHINTMFAGLRSKHAYWFMLIFTAYKHGG